MELQSGQIFIMVALLIGVKGDCDLKERISDCTRMIPPNKGIVPNWDQTTMTTACRSIHQFIDCISQINDDCSLVDSVKQQLTGTKNAMAYICGAGKNVYLRYARCLQQVKIQNSGRLCQQYLLGRDDICSKKKNYVQCIRKSVATCGDGASDLMETIVNKTFGNLCSGLIKKSPCGVLVLVLAVLAVVSW